MEGKIKSWIESRLCDGIFCISHYLVNYYKSIGIKPQKLFLVPSTVDPERFLRAGEKPLPFPYIGYFGGLTFDRDNVDLLIRSFSMISKNHPGLHLVLGGFCTDSEKRQIESLINELRLSDKIKLLKYLSRDEIINYILHSEILVMVRKDDMKAHASFPSKLTEYLASARPVISVNVGEIPVYMNDGTNTFLVKPGNKEELADKIDYVLTNYDLAMEVARKGNELTYSVFNYNYQAKRMIGFIKAVSRRKRKHQGDSQITRTVFTPAKARA
jgi:glycosyltransferase involved in cell wall biosynthesis